VILKYKNKKYSSEDLPIFLYFKTETHKKDFINKLMSYTPNEFVRFDCVDIALAGNTLITDKRSALYINLKTLEEKKHIQRYMFDAEENSNAVISTPPDIKPSTLEEWIERHTKDLIL